MKLIVWVQSLDSWWSSKETGLCCFASQKHTIRMKSHCYMFHGAWTHAVAEWGSTVWFDYWDNVYAEAAMCICFCSDICVCVWKMHLGSHFWFVACVKMRNQNGLYKVLSHWFSFSWCILQIVFNLQHNKTKFKVWQSWGRFLVLNPLKCASRW